MTSSTRSRTTEKRGDANDVVTPAREETGLAAPVRDTDTHVLQIVELMVGHSWNDERAEELTKEWGVHPVTMRRIAAEAARFIRLCQDPEKVRSWGMTKLNRLVEDPMSPPQVKVAAIKVALDATMPREPRGNGAPQLPADPADKLSRFLSALRDHNSELVGVLRANRELVLAALGPKAGGE